MYGCSVRLNTCLTRARDLRVRLGPAIKAEPVCREELAYVSFETLKLRMNRGSGSSPSPAEFRALAPVSRHRRSPTAKGERRLVKKGNRAVPQVLIKWTGVPASSATWEDYYVLKTRFRAALAWDQQGFRLGQMSGRCWRRRCIPFCVFHYVLGNARIACGVGPVCRSEASVIK